MIGGICANPNCGFIKEARKFYDHETANNFNSIRESDIFQNLVNRSAKSLNYHSDATITLKSFLDVLPVYNSYSSNVVVNTVPNLNKSLLEIAANVLGGKDKVSVTTKLVLGDDRTCIDNLSYKEAENIQLAFNRSNPFSDRYVASIENLDKSYLVVILDKNDDTYKHMRQQSPRQAAIDAVCKWFDNLGIHVTFDNINNALSANLIQQNKDVLLADGTTTTILTTLISVCGDRDLSAISDIPEDISDDVANAVAKILIDIFDKADDEDIGLKYKRFKQAVLKYKRDNNILNTSDEEIMQLYIKDEIKSRFTKAQNKLANNESAKVDKAMSYGRSRVKRWLDSIVSKWYTVKRLNRGSIKPISIKSILREARLAVDELFGKKTSYIKEHQGSVEAIGVRKHHKRILKQTINECKDAFSIAYGIEKSLKDYINAVSGNEHKERATEFENLIAMLNNTDDVFGNSDARALLAVGQTVLTLEYEIDNINIELQLLAEAFDNLAYDSRTMNNYEYVELLKKFALTRQKLNSFVEIQALLQKGLDNNILTNIVTVILPSGNTKEYSLTTSINAITDRIHKLQTAMTGLNATVAENFLVDVWGQDMVNVQLGKQLKGLLEKYQKASNAVDAHRKTSEIIHEAITNGPNGGDWWWQRTFGSMQNSSSIVNQLVGLALNQAKTIGQQETLKTLTYIHLLQSEYKRGVIEETYTTSLGMKVGKVFPGRDIEVLVERDRNGVQTGNLVRPVDYYTYEQLLKAAEEEWSKEFVAKYKNELLNDTQKAMYWNAFRQNKFNEWNKVTDPITKKIKYKFKKQEINLRNPRTGEIEKIMIYAPNPEIYPNKEWDTLSQADKNLSNLLMALKYFSNQKLNGQGSALHKIPNFRGSFTDTFLYNKKKIGATAMAKMRRNFVADLEDTEFGSVVTEIPLIEQSLKDWAKAEMDAVKRIPLYGIRPLKDMRELSTDLWSSYLAYDDMANQYATKNSIEAMIQSVGELLLKTEEIAKGDKYNPHNPNYYDLFLNYIDKELYGITKKNNGKVALVTLTKHLNTLGRIVTAAFLGGNVHSALVNLITGYNEIIKEAGVGQYINIDDFKNAFGFYIKHTAYKIIGADKGGHYNVMVHPNDSTNMLSVVLRSFDFTERYQQDTRNYNTRELGIVRTLKNSLMLPYEYTDHWMLTIPLLCFLKHLKVFTQVDTNNNLSSEITLLEALFPTAYGNRYGNVLQSPKGIDSDGNFGLFYKTMEGARKGAKIVPLILKLNAHVEHLTENPGSVINLSDEEKALLIEYNLPLSFNDTSVINTVLNTLKKDLYNISYNGADFSKTRLLAREIVNRMHGVYDTQSKGVFLRTIYGATILSMKNYAIGLINRRFGQPHWSVLTEQWDEGTLFSVSKAVIDAFHNDSKNNKLIYCLKSLFNIITPFALSTKASKQRMAERTGFSMSQIYNIQRNKMDMLRIMFFQFLTHLTKALAKGLIGGWDPEDEDALFKYTGINIDREDILEGEAFEDGGELASNPKLETIWKEIQSQEGFDTMAENLTDFEKQVLARLEHDAAVSKKQGGSVRFDKYGSGKNGFEGYLDKIYKEEEKKWNDKYGTNLNISKAHKVSLHQIKEFCKNNLITTNSVTYEPELDSYGNLAYYQKDTSKHKKGDPKFKVKYKVRATPMGAILEEKEATADKIKYLNQAIEFSQGDYKKHLQKLLLQQEKRLIGLEEILHGYNLWSAKRNHIKLNKELRAWAKKTNVSDNDLNKMVEHFTNGNNPDALAFRMFKKEYDDNEKAINTQMKYFSSKKFELDYFENTHPAAHYWLGVANYFLYRGLIEQESLIPFAGVGTSWAEKMLTQTIPNAIAGRLLTPDVKRDWEWNFSNEWASLTLDVAMMGLGRTFAKFQDSILGSLLYTDEYTQQLREAEEFRGNFSNSNYDNVDYLSSDSREERAKRIAEREKQLEAYKNNLEYRAKNTTNSLKKGDYKWTKYPKQFAPYYRTFRMFGVGDYLEDGKTDGGWNAIESYKSFYLKDRK